MAASNVSTFLLGHARHSPVSDRSNSRLPLRSPRYLPISCRIRNRNSKRAKEVSPKQPQNNVNFQPIENEKIEEQKPNVDGVSSPHPETASDVEVKACIEGLLISRSFRHSADENAEGQSARAGDVSNFHSEMESGAAADACPIIDIHNGPDVDDATLSEEVEPSNRNAKGVEQLSNIRLEDLIGMIRNAEKNITLINQARVCALEDLNKTLSEKEDLQGQIDVLEMRLAETDARIKVVSQDKIHVELLENQLEKLENELFERDGVKGSSPGLHVVHIAAEMAPVAKVGGLGDVVCGLCKALQKKGHLVEVVLPKYDCMQYDRIADLEALDVVVESYFDGHLFKNKIWFGTIEGIPVYFVEPHHPAKFFWRGQVYGEHDDFKRFSFFSRAALELLLQAGKRPDIIHCHDWQTAFVAPLYWDLYAPRGLDSARVCFTCHNFEYQGKAPASLLKFCGLDVQRLNRPDRMQDNYEHDKVNPIKGAIVFSNIVTTVSPTYAQEVLTSEGGRGLQDTLNCHSKKFVGILNGIDTDAWNPSTDTFLRFQYSPDELQGKMENKEAIRKYLKLFSADATRPMVGCITRLVPQKGVHLIRHAIFRSLELGGQFLLLGSSPVPHIQREFEGIAKHFQNHPHIRLILKYDEALSHCIYAASDMFIIPSIFEPCGLTQMIAMRYGSVPIARKTGGLNDSVFDVDDTTIPVEFRNGFTFSTLDEQGVNSALERAFDYYIKAPEKWQQLVQKDMKIDFSWNSSSAVYEELYEKSVTQARAARANR